MEQRAEFTLRDLAHVVFKRKAMIACLFLTTVCTVAIVSAILDRPMYEATSQILLRAGREHSPAIMLPNGGAGAASIRFDPLEQAAETTEMLTGRYLNEQVVQAVGARKICREPIRWPFGLAWRAACKPEPNERALFERVVTQLQENLRAQRVNNAALVNLSFRHEDAEIAATVVNTLGYLYLERHLGILKDPRADAFLQEQSGVLNERLSQAQQDLESFKAGNGISSTIKEEHELAVRQLAALQAEHGEARSRAAEVDGRIAHLKLIVAATSPQTNTETRDRLMQLERKESEMTQRLGEHDPSLIAVREELRQTRDKLYQFEERKAEERQSSQSSLYQRTQEDLLRNETELRALRARLATQAPALAELKKRVEKLDRIEPEFERLQQRARMEQENYRMYVAKSEATRVSNAMDAAKIASIKIIQPASTPVNPMSSRLGLKLLLAAIFGALGALVLAFGMEIFSDRLETAERTQSVLQVPVLASFPDLPLAQAALGHAADPAGKSSRREAR